MSVVPGVEDSALVIGDSQAGPDTWVGLGLEQAGYPAIIRGAIGTGYVEGNGSVAGYARALEAHQWLLPWGTPRLILLQGGGNDITHPASDIRAEALRLIRGLRQSYPSVRIVMVGVIGDGTGPRSEVDRVLAAVAAEQGIDFLTPGNWWARYGLNGRLRPDGRHLSPEGHRIAAGVFAHELARMSPPAIPQTIPHRAVS
nr:SGNH/GDSL hydrolase family protein [Arthrobacter sp. zg-Y769]